MFDNYKKKNFNDFYKDYSENFTNTLNNIDIDNLNKLYERLVKKIKNNKKIFIIGNGGSASVANHFMCDFNKGVKLSSKKKLIPKVISLSNSLEVITAISNDINYDEIFSSQLENYFSKGDLLLALSCSGKSKNILNAINFAKKNHLDTILITGFAKKKMNDCLHIDLGIKNYGISEDIFSVLMHTISQYIRYNFMKNTQVIL